MIKYRHCPVIVVSSGLPPLYMMSPFFSQSKVKGLCCLCSCPNSSLRPSYVCDKMLQFFRWYLSLVTFECTKTLLNSGTKICWKKAEGNNVFCVLSFLRLKIVFKIKRDRSLQKVKMMDKWDRCRNLWKSRNKPKCLVQCGVYVRACLLNMDS